MPLSVYMYIYADILVRTVYIGRILKLRYSCKAHQDDTNLFTSRLHVEFRNIKTIWCWKHEDTLLHLSKGQGQNNSVKVMDTL